MQKLRNKRRKNRAVSIFAHFEAQESSPHIVDKRNLALKHKIVHHNKMEAEAREEKLLQEVTG